MKDSNNDINRGINCDVCGCVYNEKGCKCNLEKVTISKGNGGHHYCKSYIPLNEEEVITDNLHNVESAEDIYIDYHDLGDDEFDIGF